jgi:hypothetical protein
MLLSIVRRLPINTLRQGIVTTLLNFDFGQKIREFRKRLDIIEHDWYNSKNREFCNTALCMREAAASGFAKHAFTNNGLIGAKSLSG